MEQVIFVSVDAGADEMRAHFLRSITNLLDGGLKGGEFNEGEECRREVGVVLIESIQLDVGFEEGEQLHPNYRVDEQGEANHQKDVACLREH